MSPLKYVSYQGHSLALLRVHCFRVEFSEYLPHEYSLAASSSFHDPHSAHQASFRNTHVVQQAPFCPAHVAQQACHVAQQASLHTHWLSPSDIVHQK